MQETLSQFLGREDPLEKDRLPTPVFVLESFHGQECGGLRSVGSQRVGCDWATLIGFSHGSVGKNLPTSARDAGVAGSIYGLERSPGGGNGNLLLYSCLKTSMDRGAWQATVHWDMTERLSKQCLLTLHFLLITTKLIYAPGICEEEASSLSLLWIVFPLLEF